MTVAALLIPSGTGMIAMDAMSSVYNIATELSEVGVSCKMQAASRALVYSARQTLWKWCLDEDMDYVFWHDDDMLVPVGGVLAMYQALKEHEDLTGISALTATRSLTAPRIPICWKEEDGFLDHPPDGIYSGVKECFGFGLATCLFDVKKTKAALDAGGFGFEFEDQNPFLPMPIPNRRVLGEDLAFCKRLVDNGAELACHCDVRPGHLIDMEMNADIVFGMYAEVDQEALRAMA